MRKIVALAFSLLLLCSAQAQNSASFPSGGGGAPSGTAGGDLSGTYPNPAVAKATGLAGSGTICAGADNAGTFVKTTGPCQVLVGNQLVGYVKGMNTKNTGDVGTATITIPAPGVSYRIQQISCHGVSGAFNNAFIGLYTGVAQSGTTLFSQNGLGGITATGNNVASTFTLLTPGTGVATSVNLTLTSLIFNVGTGQGTDNSLDCFIYAQVMP